MNNETWVWGPEEEPDKEPEVKEHWAVQILFNDTFEGEVKYLLEEIEKKLHEIGHTRWTYVAGRIGEAGSGGE